MKIRKKDINFMKCTLFLPYTQYSDSSFTCDDNYYSDESYADALNKGLEESKNAVMMLNNSNYDKKITINFSSVQVCIFISVKMHALLSILVLDV